MPSGLKLASSAYASGSGSGRPPATGCLKNWLNRREGLFIMERYRMFLPSGYHSTTWSLSGWWVSLVGVPPWAGIV